jgi:predicted nucleotide-binding protein
MATNVIQKRQEQRAALLVAVYEKTGGAANRFADLSVLAKERGIPPEEAKLAWSYFLQQGLMEGRSIGTLQVSLTAGGVSYAEEIALKMQEAESGQKPDPDEDDVTNPAADPKRVFIIHGRNMEARKQMGIFLRAIGLDPINFDDLRASLKGTPTIADIIIEGMKLAQGVVALFTPDEYATLRPELCGKNDSGEMVERWQARPNVLFEAGMAFGKDRERVVLVRLGRVSLFTDVGGIHVLSPTNDALGDRNTLRLTLKHMGCAVNLEASDWLHDGDFDACLLPEVSTRSPFRE